MGTKRSQLGFQTLFWFLLWFFFFCEWDSSYSFTKCFEGNQPNSIFERKPQRSLLALFFISQDYKTFVVVFLLPPSFFSLFFFVFIFFGFFRPKKKKRVVKVIGSSPEVRQLPLPFLFFSFCCWFWRVCGFYEFSKFYWAFFSLFSVNYSVEDARTFSKSTKHTTKS